MADEGNAALKLTLSTSGTGWEEGGVFVDLPEPADWSTASTVSADVYVPVGAEGFLAQVFLKTGDDWTWANTPDTQLVPGEWTTVTADLSIMGDIANVRELGVKVGASVTAFEGDVFIDNVILNTPVE
jgi:hypothetical protein